MASRAEQLRSVGQSVWLDFIRRGHLTSGEFEQMVRDQGVVGVTSNPTIFELAIAKSPDYDTALERGVAAGLGPAHLFDALTIEDIQMACDRLTQVFKDTRGLDGRVSIEVSPRLAADTGATVAEGRRLHREVARPNVMIKVPATAAGLPAITALTAAGISVNVTLIFSIARYEQVMEAYLTGLELRAAASEPIDDIRSVASFFVSRVDSKIDAAIKEAVAALPAGDARRTELESYRGKAAIANARLAYERFEQVFATPRFTLLKGKGANVQRPLWASTSTKDPSYPDTLYVDELIGPDTVNTMPPQTLTAFNEHGTVAVTIRKDVPAAHALFGRLPELGIPIDAKIAELEGEGVVAFAKSYDSLLATLETRHRELVAKG